MGIGQGVVRHMTQWALLVWSVTQVWVPGQTTLEHDSVRGTKKEGLLAKKKSVIFCFLCVNSINLTYFCTLLGTWPPGLGVPCSGPSAEYTHPYMTSRRCRTQHASGKCQSSLESTHTGAFPSSFCKPSRDCIWLPHKFLQKHSEWFHMCMSTAQCQCNVTVLTSLQTSGDPQASSYKTSLRSGVFPNHNTPCTIFTIITSLYWPLHTGVSRLMECEAGVFS